MYFDRRSAINLLLPFAKTADNVADAVPVPGLKPAIHAITKLLELLQGRYDNDDELYKLLVDAIDLICVLNEWGQPVGGRAAASKEALIPAVTTAVNTLQVIGDDAQKKLFGSWFRRVIFSQDETKVIAEWRRQLDHAIAVFQTHSHLKLNEAMHVLRWQTLSILMGPEVISTATHDTSDKDSVIRCLPGTRTGFLGDLENWIRNPDNQQLALLSAPAGSGKSAICRSLCLMLGKGNPKERVSVGSFFLFKESNRTSVAKLIPTWLWQIANLDPVVRSALEVTIAKSGPVSGKGLQTQFEHLFVDTFKATSLPTWPPILFVLDGLDECNDLPGRSEVIKLLYDSLTHLPPSIKFLVSSRPEADIINTVCGLPFKRFSIKEDDSVVQAILDYTFHAIQRSRPRRVPPVWPEDGQVKQLLENSSGYPIYASIAMEYVKSGPGGPKVALNNILRTTQSENSPRMEKLHNLYLSILTAPKDEYLQRTLALFSLYDTINASSCQWPSRLTTQMAANIIVGHEGDGGELAPIEHALSNIQSLVTYLPVDPPEEDWKPNGNKMESISFYHKSFTDFLPNKSRKDFPIDLTQCAWDTVRGCARMLADKSFLVQQAHRSFEVLPWHTYKLSERSLYHRVLCESLGYVAGLGEPMPQEVRNDLRSYDFSDIDISFGFKGFRRELFWGSLYNGLVTSCKEYPDLISHFRQICQRCLVEEPDLEEELDYEEVLEVRKIEQRTGSGI